MRENLSSSLFVVWQHVVKVYWKMSWKMKNWCSFQVDIVKESPLYFTIIKLLRSMIFLTKHLLQYWSSALSIALHPLKYDTYNLPLKTLQRFKNQQDILYWKHPSNTKLCFRLMYNKLPRLTRSSNIFLSRCFFDAKNSSFYDELFYTEKIKHKSILVSKK